MRQAAGLVNVLPAIPILLAHLAGVVVAVILLIRQQKRSLPALLALVGFTLHLALDVANFARGPLIRFLSHRTGAGARSLMAGVGCCCSVFDVAAIVCLIIAIWQAVSSASLEGAG
jgi:type III secretory pathway component EscS